MVTGDNINTAKAIARECGILTDGEAIEGPKFRVLNPEEMRKLIPNLQVTSPMGLVCSCSKSQVSVLKATSCIMESSHLLCWSLDP